jgi:hypothetical protein
MAANYATGISSSPTNLLTTVVSFLTGQGWTLDASSSDGSGWRAHLHKNGLYVNFRAAMNERIWVRDEGPPILYRDYGDGGYGIGLYLGDGYSGALEWYEQSGGPDHPPDSHQVGAGANLPSGSVAAYHIFDDGSDNIVVVVEKSPGIFCHFGFGPDLSEAGQPEDFPYFFGAVCASMNTHDGDNPDTDAYGLSASALPPMTHGGRHRSISGPIAYAQANAYVRVDAATYSARWVHNGYIETGNFGGTGRFLRCALNLNPATEGTFDEEEFPCFVHVLDRTHQTAYAGALQLPLHLYCLTDPDARWAPMGYAPSIYWTEAVGHGYAAGDVYAIGGVNYMLFPHFAVYKGV